MVSLAGSHKTFFRTTIDDVMNHRILAILTLFTLLPLGLRAQEQEGDDFIRVSLCVASPGEEVYAMLGHAFIRTECPSQGLDICYTEEAEDLGDETWRFLAGRLQMRMVPVPTSLFLEQYASSGRTVKQYPLQLSNEVEHRLWQILDQRVAEGSASYDFFSRGCAYSCYQVILDALSQQDVTFPEWGREYERTPREIVRDASASSPWSQFCWMTLVGGEADVQLPPEQKVYLPEDLARVLQGTLVDGVQLVSGDPEVVVEGKAVTSSPSFLSPLVVSLVLLLLVLGVRWKCKGRMLLPFVVLHALMGLFVWYIAFASGLPTTGWSWLVIPFNPFVLLLWKWHGRWGRYFVAAIVVWAVIMVCMPHRPVEYSHILMAFAYLPLYL